MVGNWELRLGGYFNFSNSGYAPIISGVGVKWVNFFKGGWVFKVYDIRVFRNFEEFYKSRGVTFDR